MSMGFPQSSSLIALRQCNGNLEQAVELLINGGVTRSDGVRDVSTNPAQQPAVRSGRLSRAAEAAESRRDNNPLYTVRTKQDNRNVAKGKGTKQSNKQKSFEDRVEEASKKLATTPQCVDTLIYVIGTILSNPKEKKYREIKMTNKRFESTVGKAGKDGTDFLLLLGFTQAGDWFVLRGTQDSAKLWIGKSCLEKRKTEATYQVAKDRLAFEKALEESMASANEEEQARKDIYSKKVPVEPDMGIAGTTRITVFVLGKVLQRRFSADDTLKGVIMWLGATHCSLIPDKLSCNEWELIDKTLYPLRAIDIVKQMDKTLQSIELWPSAELLIQPAGTLKAETAERERDANST